MADLCESFIQWVSNMENWKDLATVLSGFSTLVIAFFTLFLWRENRLLHQAGSEPRVVAHFDMHPDGTGAVNMSLSNIGTGSALDVYFELEADQEDFTQYSIQLDIARKRAPMTLISQGEKVSFLFGISFDLFRKKGKGEIKPLNPFTVVVRWRSINRKEKFCERYTLDISQYAGLPGMMGKPPLLKVVDELKGIKKQLSEIASCETSMVDLIDATQPDQSIRALLFAKNLPSDSKGDE